MLFLIFDLFISMNESVKKIISSITEQINGLPQPAPQLSQQPQTQNSQQPYSVVFDNGQAGEFRVKFSERGFLIDGTRLSFESLEDAISKNYNIHLNGGQGVVLDAVRMQKILKYKNR